MKVNLPWMLVEINRKVQIIKTMTTLHQYLNKAQTQNHAIEVTYGNILKFFEISCNCLPQVCHIRDDLRSLCLCFSLHLSFSYFPV
jgi:hypothetical protein